VKKDSYRVLTFNKVAIVFEHHFHFIPIIDITQYLLLLSNLDFFQGNLSAVISNKKQNFWLIVSNEVPKIYQYSIQENMYFNRCLKLAEN
jgi:hypothetical protein